MVLNAGLLQRDELDSLDFDSIQQQFEVNAMGPLRVVAALRSQLRPGSKASNPSKTFQRAALAMHIAGV